MTRAAIVNLTNKLVERVLIVGADYAAPAGFVAVPTATGNIGDSYDGTQIVPRPAPAPSKAELEAYNDAKWAAVIDKGTVTVDGFQSQTNNASQTFVNGLISAYANNAAFPGLWNGVAPITAAQAMAVGLGVAGFVQTAFNAHAANAAAIVAGTITTTAQIDAAAWPANS